MVYTIATKWPFHREYDDHDDNQDEDETEDDNGDDDGNDDDGDDDDDEDNDDYGFLRWWWTSGYWHWGALISDPNLAWRRYS